MVVLLLVAYFDIFIHKGFVQNIEICELRNLCPDSDKYIRTGSVIVF